MEITLSNSVEIIAILTFAAALLRYTVIVPLQTAIATLKEAVDEVKTMLKELSDDQRSIDKRLVAVEESAKQAHKRLDGMEHVLQ